MQANYFQASLLRFKGKKCSHYSSVPVGFAEIKKLEYWLHAVMAHIHLLDIEIILKLMSPEVLIPFWEKMATKMKSTPKSKDEFYRDIRAKLLKAIARLRTDFLTSMETCMECVKEDASILPAGFSTLCAESIAQRY